jgi:signal transduction histidine kinase
VTDGVGGRDRAIRRAAVRATSILGSVEQRAGLRGALAVAAECLLEALRAPRVVLVVRDVATGNVFRWRGGRLTGPDADPIAFDRVAPGEAPFFLPTAAAYTWAATRDRANEWKVVVLDRDGMPAPNLAMAIDPGIAEALQAAHHLLALVVGRPGEWEARLFVIDAAIAPTRASSLTAARYLVDRMAVAMDNAYLLHRLRVRSAGNERQRIARELHDGIIQSVMAVQIQLHALSARLSSRSHPVAHDLARLAGVLRDEALALREMMQGMQPAELDPDRLVDTIAGTVQRFQHETGISARFIANVDRLPLPPRSCRELAHVVQEALVNVRKHSGASQVKVTLTRENGVCLLSIDDDGGGFPFSGRLTAHDAAYEQVGPRVIRERIRRIGGDLSVVSAQRRDNAPSGARLAISIPLPDKYAIAG